MTQSDSGVSAANGAPLVVLEHVDKWFGDLHVLQDINLSVARGEVVIVDERLGVTMTEIIKDGDTAA